MDILKTILLYLSMLFISSVQVAPDPATVHITPTPAPTPFGIVITATPIPTPSPTPVPTPDITPNSTYGQLNMGDRDETVTQMQQRLQELGYYKGEIDGAYGNQTRHAVELFQYQNGLTVDGIAGKYTLTILYEDPNAKAAPPEIVVTSTPVFYPDETITPPPVTEAPEATASPTPAASPEIAEPSLPITEMDSMGTEETSAALETPEEPEQTDTMAVVATETPAVTPTDTPAPAATQTAAPTETPQPKPILMDNYSFVFSGFTDTITSENSDAALHPAEWEEEIYIPLTEILKGAGNVVITDEIGSVKEIAFSVLTNFYKVSYSVTEDGTVSDLSIDKDAEPQPLVTRNAVVLDEILYLPLQDVQRLTGIGFVIDDVSGMITVTMP